MSLWVKICGNTSAADALAAVEAGADAVGFVFAASPRKVTESEVAGIVARLPKTVEFLWMRPWRRFTLRCGCAI